MQLRVSVGSQTYASGLDAEGICDAMAINGTGLQDGIRKIYVVRAVRMVLAFQADPVKCHVGNPRMAVVGTSQKIAGIKLYTRIGGVR
jgi:hypothetical protein